MLSNITPCCRKCLNPNETLYVEVRNNCDYYIYMYIEYLIDEKLFKKQSPVFPPGKSQRLSFQTGCTFLYLKVFNCALVPPSLFSAKYIKTYVSTCYVVAGHSASTLVCVEVPC